MNFECGRCIRRGEESHIDRTLRISHSVSVDILGFEMTVRHLFAAAASLPDHMRDRTEV